MILHTVDLSVVEELPHSHYLLTVTFLEKQQHFHWNKETIRDLPALCFK